MGASATLAPNGLGPQKSKPNKTLAHWTYLLYQPF